MLCLFQRVHRLQPQHHNEGRGELEEWRGTHQRRVMIKTTKGSDGRRKRRGGLLVGEGCAGEKLWWRQQWWTAERLTLRQDGSSIVERATYAYLNPSYPQSADTRPLEGENSQTWLRGSNLMCSFIQSNTAVVIHPLHEHIFINGRLWWTFSTRDGKK